MKLWPFGRRNERKPGAISEPEPSAMDRLLNRDCNRDEFFLLCVKLIEERLPSARFEMTGDSAVRAVAPSGKEATFFMDNVWISYEHDKENRRDLLERYMSTAADFDRPAAGLSREQVIAIVKDSNYISMFKPEHHVASEHLCGDLWIVYAEDLPDRTSSLKKDRLQNAGIADDELLNLAKDNLRRILPPAQRQGDGPWYMVTAGGDYTASLLLFDGLWDDLADSVEGDLVAVAPSRDVLLYTGSESKEGLAAIRQRATEILATGNYLISETLIVRVSGRWEVFKAN
jgi:uncharacterized protein YtpQ (UPF0354 family)